MRALALALLVLSLAPATALGEAHGVGIPGRYFSPATLTVVAGDTVTWRNGDFTTHDVAADDGTFTSGALGRFGSYTARLDVPGAHPYLCTIHPFMRGEVVALAAVLSRPSAPVLAGELVPLSGRTAPGTAVTVERRAGDGPWGAVGSAVAGADGAFSVRVVALEGAVYRAVTAGGASGEISLSVTARLDARLRVRAGAHAGRARVIVRTAPARPGLVATLQRWSRERFMWRRIDHARLDAAGRAQFGVRARGRVRVLLSRVERGAVLATTDAVRARDGRRVGTPGLPEHPQDDHASQDEQPQDDHGMADEQPQDDHGTQDEHPH